MPPTRRPPTQRFWPKVTPSTTGECWLWTGTVGKHGYGNFGMGGKYGRTEYAHRFAYLDMVGEIPDGYEIDHLCRNRLCVNPDHLDPVPRAENNRRMAPYRAAPRPARCKRGHRYGDSGNSYVDRHGRQVCRVCKRITQLEREARAA